MENYRKEQIDPVLKSAENDKEGFAPKIQLSHGGVRTHWMDISIEQLREIEEILSGAGEKSQKKLDKKDSKV